MPPRVVRQHPGIRGFALWGLDQEFVGSAGTLLEAMQATGPGTKTRAAIAQMSKADKLAEHRPSKAAIPASFSS